MTTHPPERDREGWRLPHDPRDDHGLKMERGNDKSSFIELCCRCGWTLNTHMTMTLGEVRARYVRHLEES
jgi:hypothetical protein